MKPISKGQILLGLIAALAIGTSIWLTFRYNLGTGYASEVRTATQTVRMCHNSCRYVAPDVALRLHLSSALFLAGGLALVGLAMWRRIEKGPPGDTDPTFLGKPYAIATAVNGVLHGAAFAGCVAAFYAPDWWREQENPAPAPGFVYDPAAHHGLSYSDATQATLDHIMLPVWGTLMVFTLIALGLRALRGAGLRQMDRHDLPMLGFQIAGAVIAALVLVMFGPAIIDALIDSPLGPN